MKTLKGVVKNATNRYIWFLIVSASDFWVGEKETIESITERICEIVMKKTKYRYEFKDIRAEVEREIKEESYDLQILKNYGGLA